MSEYNLKIRNEFFNKLVYKINDLNKNLELLQKVNKKIFKNMKGGTIISQTEVDRVLQINPKFKAPPVDLSQWKLVVETQNKTIENANESIEKANLDIEALADFIEIMNTMISQLTSKINHLMIPVEEEPAPAPPPTQRYERTLKLQKLLEEYRTHLLTLAEGRKVIKTVTELSDKYNSAPPDEQKQIQDTVRNELKEGKVNRLIDLNSETAVEELLTKGPTNLLGPQLPPEAVGLPPPQLISKSDSDSTTQPVTKPTRPIRIGAKPRA